MLHHRGKAKVSLLASSGFSLVRHYLNVKPGSVFCIFPTKYCALIALLPALLFHSSFKVYLYIKSFFFSIKIDGFNQPR
jgi:hypothetical protein